MSRPRKHFDQSHHTKARLSKVYDCPMCGRRFRSRSHLDTLCNACWADNELKPYVTRSKSYWGTGPVS